MTLTEVVSMGIVAGLSPSPHSIFLSYIQTRRGRGGVEVLLGGLGADLLIISLSLALSQSLGLGWLRNSESVLRAFSFCVILWMAFKIFVPSRGPKKELSDIGPSSVFLKALGIQLLNANPYLFWFGVFAPIMRSLSLQRGVGAASLFLFVTYSIKWLMYAKSVQFFGPSVRLSLIRMAFLVFLLSYFLRQVEV